MTEGASGHPNQSPGLVTVSEHLERILAEVSPLPPIEHPLMEAFGLSIAEDVSSTIELPGFDNSAMDGYAVRAEDVAGASAQQPVQLPVVGEIGAGQARLLALSPGSAVKIMTGAPMPRGADAVVPYEATDRGVARVTITEAARVGSHIRRAGEDVRKGDLLLEEGTVLGPRQIGLLANVGRAGVRARPRPRVVVISTGSELREPGSELSHDSIYDGNSFLLAAAARSAGAIAYRVGAIGDDAATFANALSDQLVRADLVVTSGGVSEGDYDVVKEALSSLGTVWFGKVAMQPGKPQGFGVVGEDRVPILTLPGNPVSAYVSFELFVRPALRRMMGRLPYSRPVTRARLTQPLNSAPGRRQFLRGVFEPSVGKGAQVTPMRAHGSHLVGDLAQANCLIVVPEATTGLSAGEQVEVLVLDQEH